MNPGQTSQPVDNSNNSNILLFCVERLAANSTHFLPQLASVRAGSPGIVWESGPHASTLRLKIYKVSGIGLALKPF